MAANKYDGNCTALVPSHNTPHLIKLEGYNCLFFIPLVEPRISLIEQRIRYLFRWLGLFLELHGRDALIALVGCPKVQIIGGGSLGTYIIDGSFDFIAIICYYNKHILIDDMIRLAIDVRIYDANLVPDF